jgi:hypothetical protein
MDLTYHEIAINKHEFLITIQYLNDKLILGTFDCIIFARNLKYLK